MLLKLEEVAEERQVVVRCGAANRVSVLPATTPAFRGLEGLIEICLPEEHKADDDEASQWMGLPDVAVGKPGFLVGTPHLDCSLPPLFDVG